jgi:hypothetical protein
MSFSLRKASELVRLNSPLRMPADDDGPLRTETSHHGDAAARMAASLQLESPSAPLVYPAKNEAARTRNDGMPRPTPATVALRGHHPQEGSIDELIERSRQQLSTIN